MKLLIDMNLSPLWVDTLTRHGWEAVHWSTVGDPHATAITSCLPTTSISARSWP